MSRSRRPGPGRNAGCGWACTICHPLWRDASEKALTVEEDLAAIDHMHWSDVFSAGGIDHADPWWRECDVCGSDVTFYACDCTDRANATPPLRVPLAAFARRA